MKLAVAGCGETGSAFIRAALRNGPIDLAGAYDPDKFSYEGLSGIHTFDTLDKLFGSDCDSVLLAAPQRIQPALAHRALDAGKSVAIPMPISTDRAEAISLIDRAVEQGLKLIPINIDRYCGNVMDAKRHIDSERIGRIGIAEMQRAVPKGNARDADAGRSGGAPYQLILPDLDTLIYWLGDIDTAYGFRRRSGETDFAVLTVQAASGAVASISALWGGMEPYRREYELSGSGGNLRFDSRNADSAAVHDGRGLPHNVDRSLESQKDAAHSPYSLALADIAQEMEKADMSEIGAHTAKLYEIVGRIEETEDPENAKEAAAR